MSALETLAAKGFTQDDLVKMASARLFAQECAEEGVDLTKMASAQQDQLFEKWIEMKKDPAKVATAAAPVVAPVATTTEPAKTASAETVKEAATKEAAAKCAEMEILGRYLAQVFVNETNKLATAPKETATKAAGAEAVVEEAAKAAPGVVAKGMEWAGKNKRTLAEVGGGAALAGGGAVAGRMTGGKKESEFVVNLHKVANYAKTGKVEGSEKCANALEEAVCANIYDKLAAANFDVSCFHEAPVAEPAKEASAEEIEAAVEEMAVNTLKNLGYTFGA